MLSFNISSKIKFLKSLHSTLCRKYSAHSLCRHTTLGLATGISSMLPTPHCFMCLVSITLTTDSQDKHSWDFPGDPVVKNLPCNAGEVGSILGWGMKIPHAATTEPARHN